LQGDAIDHDIYHDLGYFRISPRVSYLVKEIYYTLQGEGANVGMPAVLLRFAGCNLWSGRETDRLRAACQFCDTDFVGTNGPGGGHFSSAKLLSAAVAATWKGGGTRFVVVTGGEPGLQLDNALVDALHAEGFRVAAETNGTLSLPAGVDWVCVSPKGAAPLMIRHGDELKLVFPQGDAHPEQFVRLDFRHFFLQPMDGPDLVAHTQRAVGYCLAHPRWRLSLQVHKLLNLR
jgi:7-carboxy-7-deazaguanine synthase (Cx14CxxC type)